MNILDDAYITEQNKIASSGVWIWLLEIATTGLSTLRFANNNEDIVWPSAGGNTYSKISFGMDDLNISTSGEFPTYKLQIGEVDLSGTLRTRIKSTAGLVGSTVRLMVVHSGHLDLTTPAIDEIAEILYCEQTASAVIFTIGIPSLLSRRFPRDRYVPSFCRHKFAGALCQYVQPTTTLVSNAVKFYYGDQSGDHPVNRIEVGGVNLVQELFRFALPLGIELDDGRWDLDKDTGFTVSGSLNNDGFFLADSWYDVGLTYVYVKTEADGGARPFENESVVTGVTFQLGYDKCDHTLEACKLRDNTQNYGGSPGIAGGIYG